VYLGTSVRYFTPFNMTMIFSVIPLDFIVMLNAVKHLSVIIVIVVTLTMRYFTPFNMTMISFVIPLVSLSC
jgi:hypothetical protein